MKDDDAKDISFKESFRMARQLGRKDFSHDGKKYSTELASSKPTTKAEAPAASKPASSPAPASAKDNEVPSSPRYKQDTYETPLKSAARKYGSEAMDNAGKIAAGLGIAGAAGYVGRGVLKSLKTADKARGDAALAAGNAKLADRMKGITSKAADKVAEGPALKKANESLATRMEVAKSTAKGKADRAQRSQQGVTVPKDEYGFYRAGGMTSSRADGIATKGKTNCKVY